MSRRNCNLNNNQDSFDEIISVDSDGSWETTSSNSCLDEGQDIVRIILNDLQHNSDDSEDSDYSNDSDNLDDSDYEEDSDDDENEYYDGTSKPISIDYSYHKTNPTTQKEDCGICLDDSGNLVETNCKHIFHSECLDKWFLTSENCPSCRKEFKFKEKFYIHEFDKFFEEKDFDNIETLEIFKTIIGYNCDKCDKTIEEEIRYHKKGFNYDLCEECYNSVENINNDEFIKIESEYYFLDQKKIPSKIKNLILDGQFNLSNVMINSNNLLNFSEANITDSSLESNNLSLSSVKISNSNIKSSKILNLSNIVTDDITLLNTIKNISENNTEVIVDAYFKMKDQISWVFREPILNSNYNNLTQLILLVNKLVFTNCDFDLSNSKLTEITIGGFVFNKIIGFPKSLKRLNITRLSIKKDNQIDLSECNLLCEITIKKTPLTNLKLCQNILNGKSDDEYSNEDYSLIVVNCGLETIGEIPKIFTSIDLSSNKLTEDSFTFNQDTSYEYISLSRNRIKCLKSLPKKINSLMITHNLLKEVDLTDFSCNEVFLSYNKISKLVQNENLSELVINNNYLKDIHLNKKIWLINISNNRLENLSIDDEIESITNLNCSNNKLKKIDLKNKLVSNFNCSNNLINEIVGANNLRSCINISKNPIKNFKLNSNHINNLNINKTLITKLDINENIHDDIRISVFCFEHSKIKNKILFFKKKEHLNNKKRNYIIINESNTYFNFINNN